MVEEVFYNLTIKLLVSHSNNGKNTTIRLSFEDGSHDLTNTKISFWICILGGLHFVMLRKGFQIEPLLYLGSILFLLSARVDIRKWWIFAADRKSKAPTR